MYSNIYDLGKRRFRRVFINMKAFEWTFILLFIATSVYQVLADTEIILKEPQKGVLWTWHSVKVLKEGAGWNAPSTAKPEYSVCDISTSDEPTNWLPTDFIDVKDAKLLNIEMEYTLLNCPSSGQQFKHCKTEFSLYVLHENIRKFLPPDPSKVKFQKVVTITHKVLPKPNELKEYKYACKVATMARGVYLAFLDQGVCFSIKRITVSYNYCSAIGSVLMAFRRTVAPVNDSQLVEQASNCTDGNSISKVKLSGVCLSSGEWNITDGIECLCKAGYELVNGSVSNPLECNGVPAAAEIIDLPSDTKEGEVTIKWNEPNDNGAPITQYTVYQRTVLGDGTTQQWHKTAEVKDPSDRKVVVTLEKGEKGEKYELAVTATNRHGESLKEEEKIKRITVGDVPAAVKFTHKIKDGEITLTWKEPENNGAAITQYSVYQRIVNDEQWTRIATITDISKREYFGKVKKGKEYEFAVTATNTYGESSKKDSIKKVKVSGDFTNSRENQSGCSCDDKKILHAVYVTVIVLLLMSNLVLFFFFWRMRMRPENSERSNRRKKCPRCGDLIAMNPITVQVEADTQPSSVAQKVDAPTYATPVGADYMPLHPSTRSWEIRREQVNIIKVIGKGAFSKVAQATVWNIRGSQKSITVAVKMLKADAPASDKKDLLSELELMKKMKPHPHVIKLLGCVTESDPLLVLIEYVPFGDLLGYLRKSRGLNDTYFKDPDVKPQTNLTAEQLMKFAWQVTDGMCYLSSKKIIHRDLAARNVLVGEGEKCKVTDFGMARNVQQDDIYNRTSRGRLPVKWTAYEALTYGTYTTQSDVWSYGILLYEILTVGGSPYPGINARQIAGKLQEGYRMPKPKHVESKLYQIMLKCWEENPVDRPTFEKLRKTMKEMERNHQTYVNLNQYDHSLYANINDLTA